MSDKPISEMRAWLEGEREQRVNCIKAGYAPPEFMVQIAIVDSILAELEKAEPTNEKKASMIDTLDFLRVEVALYRLEGVDDLPPEHLKNIKKIEDCILLAALEPEAITPDKQRLFAALADWANSHAMHDGWSNVDKADYDVISQCIERAALSGPRVTEKIVGEWFEKNAPPCTCDEAYTSRGMTAPDCLRHQGLDAEDLTRMLNDLGILGHAAQEGEKE
jgi:hypothetical protein